MGVNITTIVYLRVLIIQIGSTIILMVVEAQGIYSQYWYDIFGAAKNIIISEESAGFLAAALCDF